MNRTRTRTWFEHKCPTQANFDELVTLDKLDVVRFDACGVVFGSPYWYEKDAIFMKRAIKCCVTNQQFTAARIRATSGSLKSLGWSMIKLASVQLARKYMKRVASELDNTINVPEKEPMREFILLQGVRFAFRVHQFAGGFDAESMRAFEELRGRAHAQDEATDRSSSTN